MSFFIKHEPCPKCGSRDNVALYSDGGRYCFGCGWSNKADRFIPEVECAVNDIQLDADLGFDYPRHVVEWLDKYGITVAEGLKHGWKYTPSRDQLVFIFRDENGRVELTQARNFSGAPKRKYFTQGSVASLLPVFHSPLDTGKLVIVEDILSAAKISRQCSAIPCLGSHMPKNKLKALRLFYNVLYVWLDADKLNDARALADQAKWLGFKTRVIYTPLDPKEYSNAEIAEQLQGA